MRIIIVCALSLLAVACKPDLPAGVLPKEKMEKVLWELLEAEEWSVMQHPADTLARKEAVKTHYQEVFQVNNITAEDFKKSYNYYCDHPRSLGPVLDSLRNRAIPQAVIEPGDKPRKRPKVF